MATSTPPPPPPPPRAPWRSLFESQLTQNSTQEFALATVSQTSSKQPLPKVRTCGFRGFFPTPTLHPNAKEELERLFQSTDNSSRDNIQLPMDEFESDMLSFTTDVRMEKVEQMLASGGVVEAVFWLKDVASQWRVSGRAFVVGGSDDCGVEGEARREVRKGLRLKEKNKDNGPGGSGIEGDDDGLDWEKAVTVYFANHSPVMRGSFKSPPPGHPKSELPADPSLKPGQKVYDLHDPVARRNFRVVVIVPEEVERLDLSDFENPGRWKWTLVGDGRWEEVELWP